MRRSDGASYYSHVLTVVPQSRRSIWHPDRGIAFRETLLSSFGNRGVEEPSNPSNEVRPRSVREGGRWVRVTVSAIGPVGENTFELEKIIFMQLNSGL